MQIKIKNTLLNFDIPIVMGIINVNQDSFYAKSRINDIEGLEHKITQMIDEGAKIIDIGAMSTNPNAKIIEFEEEKKRLIPVFELILKKFSKYIFSIDTIYAETCEIAVNDYGIDIINDVSGAQFDDKMLETIVKLNVPYILTHVSGKFDINNNNTKYDNLMNDIIYYFSKKINLLHKLGLNDIIIDPGFGFSKNIEQNFELLNKLDLLTIFNKPLLVGVSRKSMIYRMLNIKPEDSLNATTALNMYALTKNANIIRVHDVKEANETITMFKCLKNKS